MCDFSFFGDSLDTKQGLVSTRAALSGRKAVALYFAANWCRHCTNFTSVLSARYNKGLNDAGLEIVFVSCDRSDDAFDQCFAGQAWMAIPYNYEQRRALIKKFRIHRIPSVVLLDGCGRLITKDGRAALSLSTTEAVVPWSLPTAGEKQQMILDCLGSELLSKTKRRHIGLFFAAGWCDLCREFTAKLIEMYNGGLKDKMEIIFVSFDNDEHSFEEFSKVMPWSHLPYDKTDAKEMLSFLVNERRHSQPTRPVRLDMPQIPLNPPPTLVVIDPNGNVITTDGSSKVAEDPNGELLPQGEQLAQGEQLTPGEQLTQGEQVRQGWLPSPLNIVNDNSPLNDEKCVVVLGSDPSALEAVAAVAKSHHDEVGQDLEAMDLKFFSGNEGRVALQLRNLTNVQGTKLILLDIPDDGAYYVCPTDTISRDVVEKFLLDVQVQKVPRQQLPAQSAQHQCRCRASKLHVGLKQASNKLCISYGGGA